MAVSRVRREAVPACPTLAPVADVYLIHGNDEGKLEAWRARVRAREAEDPSTTLETLRGDALTGEAFANAVTTLTLSVGRRYVVADGVERWKDRDLKQAAPALAEIPPETTVVMICADKAPASLVKAVEKVGGEVTECMAPQISAYPRWAIEHARELGFDLDREAAELLVERIKRDDKRRVRQQQLMRELEKLATYSGGEGKVTAGDVAALTGAAVDARTFELADAVIAGESERALAIMEELLATGEPVMYIVFGLLRALHQTRDAWAMVSAGKQQKEIQSKLGVPNFVARRIVEQARGADQDRIERALDELADVDFAIKGGSDYDEGTALTLALTRAAGAPA
jgi:DNA polymerase-3 subunit delta